MEKARSFEKSVLTRATRHHILEDGILQRSLGTDFKIETTRSIFGQKYILILLVGKPEGKRPLGRPRRRWTDNIKMDLLEVGLNVVDWIGLAQDRYRWRALVNSVMKLRVA
jgi:hypothetical protein